MSYQSLRSPGGSCAVFVALIYPYMYITSVHRIPSRMAKTEGYNENYCLGGWFGRGPSLGHFEMIFHYELKISVAMHCCILEK